MTEVFESMDEINEHSNNNYIMPMATTKIKTPVFKPLGFEKKTYRLGDMVHCNRFNGPRTDNKHYDKDKARAYINFYKSDCDQAVTLQFCKIVKDHCNTSVSYHRGWCSLRVYKSIYYHNR